MIVCLLFKIYLLENAIFKPANRQYEFFGGLKIMKNIQ